VLFAASSAAVFWMSWEADRTELEEHRALFFAAALGHVSSVHGDYEAQRFITALRTEGAAHGLRVEEAFVVADGGVDEFGISRGQSYAATLDEGLRHKALADLDGPRHKVRADRFSRATAGFGVAKEPGRADPAFVLETDVLAGGVARSAQIPVLRTSEGKVVVAGSAGVALREEVPAPPIPWALLLCTLAVICLLGTAALRRLPRWPRVVWNLTVVSMAAAGLIATAASYDNALAPQLERRLADVEIATAAAAYAQIRGEGAVTLVRAADRSYTGDSEYMLKGPDASAVVGHTSPPLPAMAQDWARRDYNTVWWLLLASLGVNLIVLLALRPFLIRMVASCRVNPWAYAYVAPSMAGMALLVFVPFLTGIGLSFYDNDARRYYFVGMENFIEILAPGDGSDVGFYWTLFSTILWTVTNVILHVVIGLGLALVLKDPALRFKRLYRVLLIVPWAIPNYITALIWKGMFNKEFGAVNQVIELVQSGLGMAPAGVDWLGGSFATAFTANLVTNTWLGFPFMMVVALGALQSIPSALYEAADIDGASAWQKFRNITLPLLKPALFPAIILGSIWTFNMFNVIYLVSGGGPNSSTEILITDAYRAFAVLGRYGLAAAYSVLIFVILLVYTLMTNKITKATEGAFD
jgi:ABC-type sugar transport system permease subunit